MDWKRLLVMRREEIWNIAKAHGVTSIRVFGSVARDQAGPGSDLDLLIDLEPNRSLMDVVGFEQDLEDALGVDVDAVTEPSLHRLIHDRVVAEAVPV